VIASRVGMHAGTEGLLITDIPGLGRIRGDCEGNSIGFSFRGNSEDPLEITDSTNNGPSHTGLFGGEGGLGGGGSEDFEEHLLITTQSDTPTFADIEVVLFHNGPNECVISALGFVAR